MDERFALPGGGLANHDLYRRACALDGVELVVLLGEATFHQYHGGAATSRRFTWDDMHADYPAIRGEPHRPPAESAALRGRACRRRPSASSSDRPARPDRIARTGMPTTGDHFGTATLSGPRREDERVRGSELVVLAIGRRPWCWSLRRQRRQSGGPRRCRRRRTS